jgi:ATP/maltotriose-dependent transcriptional regulator MalT/DNA-binding SARP family transcriptional activator
MELTLLPGSSVLQTKFTPPHVRQHMLVRQRVEALLRESLDARVTILQASTGYGKSTALAHFATQQPLLYWYTVGEGDSDPQQFLSHLWAAFQCRHADLPEIPLSLGQEAGSAMGILTQFLNAIAPIITDPALFIIDDFHQAASPEVNRLLDYFLTFMPRDLHVIIATRYALLLEHLVDWRARGELWEIHAETLAFTQEEIAALFREQYLLALQAQDVTLLYERTEGWPIALQLVWQGMRGKTRQEIAAILGHGSPSLEALFAYLAHNVLLQQPPEMQEFLLQTSILHELDELACQAVTGRDSQQLLRQLFERDLFVIEMGHGQYRYHHLFQDFLREQAQEQDAGAIRQAHLRAGMFYQNREHYDEAMYHFLSAAHFDQAVVVLEHIGENLLRQGRLDTLVNWLDALPPAQVTTHPMLIFLLGECARLRSRFEESLAWYGQAESVWRSNNDRRGVSRALNGQALVYLDTVRPAQAETLLEEALRMADGLEDQQAQARVLELLAENKLNMGKVNEAEQLRLQAHRLREDSPSEDALSVRVKLRTGRLEEARNLLEAWATAERGQLHVQRAHRETLLILALIDAIEGRAEEALRVATEAKALADQLHSPYVMAASQLRMGHALQVRGDLRQALQCYEAGIAIGDQIALRRTRAEARLGMTLVYGILEDFDSTRLAAEEGIEVANTAGDVWLVTLLQLALGTSLIHAHREGESLSRLEDTLASFRSCGDQLGVATTQLWLAVAHWRLRHRDRSLAYLDQSLALAQKWHYDFLFTRRTLFGLVDPRVVVPLLIEARRRSAHKSYAQSLLAEMGLKSIDFHPGYQLRVQTLGAFRIWQGAVDIAPKWRRLKARELLQLLITQRGRMIQREEILEALWHDQPPATSGRNFKVALNALNKILEPGRDGEQEPAFIVRSETAYGLRPGADIWIDAVEFEQLLGRAEAGSGQANLDCVRQALTLYRGDYLETDARYADWAIQERERLKLLYLRNSDALAAGLLAQQQLDECLFWCEQILVRDVCWEHAYQLMIQIHVLRHDHHQANLAFDRCRQALREHLEMEPSLETVEAWRQAQA